jgi:imidazolonepropionase-like amidohydrolase
MNLIIFFLTLSFLIIPASCADEESHPADKLVIIDHVNILDGRGGPSISNARVTIHKGQIINIAQSSDNSIANGQVIDAQGQFLLPGYIDMHAHLLFPRCSKVAGPIRFDRLLSERALSQQLDFGVTTIRSPANPTVEGLRLRDDLNSGKVRGPHAYASAELINDANMSDKQLRQTVRDALPLKPDYFKVYARLAPKQVASVINEAHHYGIPVIGHLQRTSWAQGVELGIDHLAHSVDWSSESLPVQAREAYSHSLKERGGFRARIDWLEAFDPYSPAQQHLIRELAQRRISVDITLIAYEAKFSAPSNRRFRDNPNLNAFPELRSDWQECDESTADWTNDDYQRWQAVRSKLFIWIKQMNDAGVLLVSGTDLTNEWIVPGDGLHQEFELLLEAGLSPNEILRMTGANAAEALHSNEIGIVEQGRRADLVLLSADPRISISNTRSIVWVMKGGRIVTKNGISPHLNNSIN